jgi:hypothetical protein
MISASPDVAYIHEPFNLIRDPGACGTQFKHWFTYVCEDNEYLYLEPLKNTLEFRYDYLSMLKQCKGARDFLKGVRAASRFRKFRTSGARPLLKDPIAVFSANWLATKFDMDTVVLVRHPAAFAGSLKVKNWTHPFSHFLDQPRLMQDHLHPFADEIRFFAEKEQDIVDQAALLWKLVHYMILQYKRSNPDWVFMRHEDLSSDPLRGFKVLFDRLDLVFSEDVADVVRQHSSLGSPADSAAERFRDGIHRDSVSNIRNWEKRLTKAEISRVKSQVIEISKEFYSEEDW